MKVNLEDMHNCQASAWYKYTNCPACRYLAQQSAKRFPKDFKFIDIHLIQDHEGAKITKLLADAAYHQLQRGTHE